MAESYFMFLRQVIQSVEKKKTKKEKKKNPITNILNQEKVEVLNIGITRRVGTNMLVFS